MVLAWGAYCAQSAGRETHNPQIPSDWQEPSSPEGSWRLAIALPRDEADAVVAAYTRMSLDALMRAG